MRPQELLKQKAISYCLLCQTVYTVFPIHLLYERLIIKVACSICKQPAIKITKNPFVSIFNPILFLLTKWVIATIWNETDIYFFKWCATIAYGEYLFNKDILQNKNFKYLSCLNPEFKNTLKNIAILGQKLPINIEIADEIFKLNQGEFKKVNRIDSLWEN